MGLTERVWDAFANTLKLSEKVDQLNATLAKQQTRIEDLNPRVLQGETFDFEAFGSSGFEELGVCRDKHRGLFEVTLQFDCRSQMNGIERAQWVSFEQCLRARENDLVQVHPHIGGPVL